jgi:hypothetical protein
VSEITEKVEQLIRDRLAEIKAESVRLEAALAAIGKGTRRPGRRRGPRRARD